MDQTIAEGLNFIRSNGATYYADYFPLTLGKRAKVSRESITTTPSPKRQRKQLPKYDEPEKKTKTNKRATSPKKPTKRTPTKTKSKPKPKTKKISNIRAASRPIPAVSPSLPTTPVIINAPITPPTIKSFVPPTEGIACPSWSNFNGGMVNFDDLEEYKSRTMKNTGNDERITEIVFSFDTTGSMDTVVDEVKRNIEEITTRLFDTVTGLRIGIIAHTDYCDYSESVLQVKQLCDKKEEIVAWLACVMYGCGGDAPENYEEVLQYCNRQMNWTDGSHRVLVMIGDQVAHEPDDCHFQMQTFNRPNPRAIDWRNEIDNCWNNGIKIYGVHVSTVDEYVRYFYESLAVRTCGRRIALNNFPMVTDMLLMVCFREADRLAFNDFRAEVQREGRMDPERQEMFANVSQ